MGRKAVEVTTLHGYTIDELHNIRQTTENNFTKDFLLAIIMRYQGINTTQIMDILSRARITILDYIHKWNNSGMEAIKDHRGGSVGRFTDEMKKDLVKTLMESKPTDHGFNAYSWTCDLLAEYINIKYEIKYSGEWIRRILKSEKFTYKKAQRKPTLAKKTDQIAFKKNVTTTRYCRRFF